MHILDDLPLRGRSPQTWVAHILQNFDAFLQDHASCERKAAALAMSLVVKYSDRSALIDPMISLAREELAHFRQVVHLLTQRGQPLLSQDSKDPYINDLLQSLRHGREERFLDRLVMSALVEARGCERFGLLAAALPADSALQDFYEKLAVSEAGHYKIFIRIAKCYFNEATIREAIARIADKEVSAMERAPLQATLH